jgi:hypothetical protein
MQRNPTIVVAIAALALVGTVTFVGCTSTKTAALPPIDRPATTTATVPVPTAPPTTARDVSWVPAVIATMHQEADAMSVLGDAATSGDVGGAQAACADSLTNVGDWQASASSIPLEAVRTPYTQALTELSAGLSLCASGNFESALPHIQAVTPLIEASTAAMNGGL